MTKISIKPLGRILVVLASFFFAGNALAQSDTEPPELHVLQVNTPEIFTSSEDQEVFIYYNISDKPAGLKRIQIYAIQSTPPHLRVKSEPKIFGANIKAASENTVLKIPAYTKPGLYQIYVRLHDQIGHAVTIERPALGAEFTIKEAGQPSGDIINVNTVNSCMPWHITGVSNPIEFGKNCVGYVAGVGGQFPQQGIIRGSCEVKLSAGDYHFRYGGHTGYNISIDDTGMVAYRDANPDIEGLTLGQNSIKFNTEIVRLNSAGFPGQFHISGDNKKCSQDNDFEARKKRIYVMRSAKFMVAGDWDTGGVANESSIFKMNKSNELNIVKQESNGVAEPFYEQNNPMRVSPNPYYWMRTDQSSQDMLMRGLSTEGAKPVLVVSSEKCPTGFKPWDNAKGRFLLGAGGDVGAYLGKEGGKAKVKLQKRHLPDHSHVYKTVQKTQKAIFGTAAIGVGGAIRFTTEPSPELKGRAHNNIPPYIAVNFCEPK